MPGNALLFGDEGRRSLKRGIDVLASAVGGTLGPAGRNVALDRRFGLPLIANAGYDGGLVVTTVQQRQATDGGRIGFDAVSGRNLDMVEAGIVDPAKVVRCEVENAVSVAAMILLAETVVTESVQDADRARPTARSA